MPPKRRRLVAPQAQQQPQKKQRKQKKMKKMKNGRNADFIRCICGNGRQDGDKGDGTAFIGFIQCDGCNCWQHNECMGITIDEKKAASLIYFCEECRPENHQQLLEDTGESEASKQAVRERLVDGVWDLVMQEPVERFWNLHQMFCIEQLKPGLPLVVVERPQDSGEESAVPRGVVEDSLVSQEDSPMDVASSTPDQDTGTEKAAAADPPLRSEADAPAVQHREHYDSGIDEGLMSICSVLRNDEMQELLNSLMAVRGNERIMRNRFRDLAQELIDQKRLPERHLGVLREVFQWEEAGTVEPPQSSPS